MSKSAELADLIRTRAGAEPPEFGLILGSGLGHLSAQVEGVAIPYSELPGFPHAGVSGHVPQLVIGQLEGRRVAVFGGRAHYYETGRADAMRLPLEVLAALGCGQLLLTNAAGSLRPDIPPGALMLLGDHIAFAGTNPLIGEKDERRFVPMTDAHDAGLRAALSSAAAAEGIELPEGVYCWFSGPSFETPAEIRAARVLGADAVGHVDGARDHPWPFPRPALRGNLGHHQYGRGPLGRGDQPRPHQGDGPSGRRQAGAGSAALPEEPLDAGAEPQARGAPTASKPRADHVPHCCLPGCCT